jgi:cell wall-associated protease
MSVSLPTSTSRVSSFLAAVAITSLVACAPASAPSTAPAPVAPASPARPVAQPAVSLPESPVNWQLMDLAVDGIAGTGAERAHRELLAGRQPGRTVVVAVIDGGIDTAHVDLRSVLWQNERERGGNGADDDNNGYADDLRGWNFIGGANGANVHHDTFELTRLYAACSAARRNGASNGTANGADCAKVTEAYGEKRAEITGTLQQIDNIGRAMDNAVRVLKTAISGDVNKQSVTALTTTNPQVNQARQLFLQLDENGLSPAVIAEAREAYGSQAKYGLDTLFDPRSVVGDNYANGDERRYGNSDIAGPDAKHGTHVAGIIAAVRGNGIGLDGVANGVRIMGLRAVPDGDERDKDVANAIRYAVDNGAHIINMSFGKGWSPNKPLVDAAVRYAESKGVLLVHAAGNDGEDIDVTPNFPNAVLADGTRARLWIEVGASSWKGGTEVAASFSNYGKTRVDLFAPGADIFSTVPGGEYARESGTSMAAPVVSGVAALLMAYYPELTAADVREILMASVTKLGDVTVQPPGAPPTARVKFGELSVTGGIVNAYDAVKMAEARRAARRQ